MEEQIRLLDGFYKADGHFLPIWRIEGNKVYMRDGWDLLTSFFSDCSVEYEDFGKYIKQCAMIISSYLQKDQPTKMLWKRLENVTST